jgi:hypothetical protein
MWEPGILGVVNRRVRSGFSMATDAVRLLMSMVCADLSLRGCAGDGDGVWGK